MVLIPVNRLIFFISEKMPKNFFKALQVKNIQINQEQETLQKSRELLQEGLTAAEL